MNVAALLQDSPSEDRRRPPPPAPRSPPQQHHQQQQHQQRPEQPHVSPVDRDRIQHPPPQASYPRHMSQGSYGGEYGHQHSGHTPHLPPPSSIMQDAYDPSLHRGGVSGGPRPLNPELVSHSGHKHSGHGQRNEPYNAIDVRPVPSAPPSQRPPSHHSHSGSYDHRPPSSMYPPPPSGAGAGPVEYSHHAGPPPPPHDRDMRPPRSNAASVQSFQLYPIQRGGASRPRSPPPPSSSAYPLSTPVPVSMPVALSDPSPMYTGGPPGHSGVSTKTSSPAMGSLSLPRPQGRDVPPSAPPPRAHVQPVTVTPSVTGSKSANIHGGRTATPHMEGGHGRHYGGMPEEALIREREQRRDYERERELREREREPRDRDRVKYGMPGLAAERERERERERDRERREMEMKKEREFRDDGPLAHSHSLTSSPERNGRKRDREMERERERERERTEREILRGDPRERDRERIIHAQHHPHHHHLLHHHHQLSPRMTSAGRPVEGGLLPSSVPQPQIDRLPPPEPSLARPHIPHHAHSQPPPASHNISHTSQPLHPHPRPHTHILDLSIPTDPNAPPPQHSLTHSHSFSAAPSPSQAHSAIPHPHVAHPQPSQSTGLVPIPLILPPTQLQPRTPPPIASAPPGVMPLQVPSASLGAETSRQPVKPPPVQREIISLGTFVYPRTPFPYRGHPLLDSLRGVGSPSSFESMPKEVRAEILVPALFLPDRHTNSEAAPGLKGNGKWRIWGGGVSEEHAARVYTDDSDLFLCALHAGFVTWSGARRARREGRDMRVVVRIMQSLVSKGGGGVSLGRFLGGYGAECTVSGGGAGLEQADGEVTTEEEEEEEVDGVEDDGRSLVSAGWGNGHDGAAIEIISAEFVAKGTAHAKTYPNRSQRLREYTERRQAIFGGSSAASSVESECDPWVERKSRSRKRRKLLSLEPKESALLAPTVVFGMGATHNEPGFKYDPSTLRSILFPPEPQAKRRPLDEVDDPRMDVDDEQQCVTTSSGVPTGSHGSRAVILETLRESFLLRPSKDTGLDSSNTAAHGEEKENVDINAETHRRRRYVIALRRSEGPGNGVSGAPNTVPNSAPDDPKPVPDAGNGATTESSSSTALQILHRDVSEENVLFQDNGMTVLTTTDVDGTKKGFMIEVKTWRWAEA